MINMRNHCVQWREYKNGRSTEIGMDLFDYLAYFLGMDIHQYYKIEHQL